MQEKYWWLNCNKQLVITSYHIWKDHKRADNHFFILSNRQLIKNKNHLKIFFIPPCGDNLSGKSLTWNNYLLKCRQLVWENHLSGTSSPDEETACLRKSIKWINYHPSSSPVIYSQMSIISIKGTEKCIV